MPQHKSAAKRMRKSAAQRAKNRPLRAAARRAVSAVRTAPDKETAEASLRAAISRLDRTAAKRIMHKNKANRLKSRLTKTVKAMGS